MYIIICNVLTMLSNVLFLFSSIIFIYSFACVKITDYDYSFCSTFSLRNRYYILYNFYMLINIICSMRVDVVV